MNLSAKNAKGQSYDAEVAIARAKKGFAARPNFLNRKTLWTHCYGHALNLAVQILIREMFKWSLWNSIWNLYMNSAQLNQQYDEVLKSIFDNQWVFGIGT